MVVGRSADEIGITASMIESFGDTVFRLSHNLQRRLGDPVRELDFAAIEEQRAELGLADIEIAERIGLTNAQVRYIRNLMEWRHFERSKYHRLNGLGGGHRYRPERNVSNEDQRSQNQRAQALRQAISFAPALTGRYVESGWWRNDTLRGWLEGWAARTPEAPALISGTGTITYGEFLAQVRQLAAALYGLGLRKGDVVAVQLPNLPEYLVSYAAIAYLGAVMTTIYLPHRQSEMRTLLGHSGARALICLADAGGFAAAETGVALAAELDDLDHVISLGASVDGALAYGDLMTATTGEILGEAPVAADPLLLLYTSGTTSAPKGVPHSSHTVLSNARVGVGEHELTDGDILLSAAPFGHLFGLYSFHLALCAGAANLLLPMFTPPDLVRLLAAHGATALFAGPAHIAACLKAGLFDTAGLAPLKLAILSGAALPADLARGFAGKLENCAVTQLWGMTETQAGLYSRPADPPEVGATSAGGASPGTEIRIVGEDGGELPAGEVGELCLRGPLLFPGYFDNPEANRRAFTEDGFFLSGDLARIDENGHVAIVGRTKDVINRGGIKYNPRDIEDLLDMHPEILQAAIVPMPDPVLGERACCFAVAANPKSAPELAALCAYLSGHGIAKTKLPERLIVVEEMPMTPTRKIIKGKLADLL